MKCTFCEWNDPQHLPTKVSIHKAGRLASDGLGDGVAGAHSLCIFINTLLVYWQTYRCHVKCKLLEFYELRVEFLSLQYCDACAASLATAAVASQGLLLSRL